MVGSRYMTFLCYWLLDEHLSTISAIRNQLYANLLQPKISCYMFCIPITLQDSKMMMLERSVYSARYCFVENLHNR